MSDKGFEEYFKKHYTGLHPKDNAHDEFVYTRAKRDYQAGEQAATVRATEAERKIGFTQGLVYTIANANRMYHEGAAEELWRESGLKIKDLKHCEKYDVDEIRKMLKSIK